MRARRVILAGLLAVGLAGCSLLPGTNPNVPSTPKSLPAKGYTGLFFAFPDGITAAVGSAVRVQYTPEDKQDPVTLGVLDSSTARFDAGDRLTFLAPGPVYAYGEQDGKRTYFLAVGLPVPPLPSAQQAGITMPSFEGPEWATFLQSSQDWDTFEQRLQQRWPTLNPSPSPAPMPAVDFSTQVILALVTGIGSDGEKPPVLTRLDTGASPTVQLVFPNENHQIGFGEEYAITPIYVIPRPSVFPVRIETVRLNPNAFDSIPVLPPSGPSPSPSPTPMPSPSITSSPGGVPPYPPPSHP